MKVKKCKSCGELFAGNTDKCSDCINREEERAKDMAQILLFLVMAIAGLFWRIPKFIHKKVGVNGVIIYFVALIALGFAGYFYYNGQSNKTIPNKSSPNAVSAEFSEDSLVGGDGSGSRDTLSIFQNRSD
jgi:predicted nucleic acid-binding Zn ribbon protein